MNIYNSSSEKLSFGSHLTNQWFILNETFLSNRLRGETCDKYLFKILARENVENNSLSFTVHPLLSIIEEWASTFLRKISFSGSLAKGTANSSSNDIDLLISLSSDTPETLKEIYEKLFLQMQRAGYKPKKQNVSINVRVNNYHSVDLVPAKEQGVNSQDHSLYCRKADTWIKTNVEKHIQYVLHSGCNTEIRILKLWRDQKKLDFPSFYLEMTVINALKSKNLGISGNVLEVLKYIQNNFLDAQVVDPANTNNIISDDLTREEKRSIKRAASIALRSFNWDQIVK